MNNINCSYEFGLATDLYWDPLGEEEIRGAADTGFSFFEIWGHQPWFDIYSPEMAAQTKTMVEDAGMRVRSVHAPCEADWDISSEDETVRRKSVQETILAMERCREMGGELVVIHIGRRVESEGEEATREHVRRTDKSIESFVDIQQAARDTGILAAIENQWANEVGGQAEHFLRLLETVDPSISGICFDTSHANITPGTYEMLEKVKHPFITTHLSDNNGTYDEHKPPFTCQIDWDMALGFLIKKGYRGPWLLEVTNGGNDWHVALEEMGRSIKKMESVIRKICEGD